MRCWIILDLMMPEMGGYEFMVAYHKESETPVIIHRPNPDKAAALTPLRLRRCAYAAALTPLRLRRNQKDDSRHSQNPCTKNKNFGG